MVRSVIRFLGHPKGGFILALIATLSMVVGSIFMDIFKESYPQFFPYQLTFFFNPVDSRHIWLYIQMVVFIVFGTSLFFSCIETSILLIQKAQKRYYRLSIVLIHISFILTLVAHLYNGFWGGSYNMELGTSLRDVPDIGKIRLLNYEVFTHPDQSLKDIQAEIEITNSEGEVEKQIISYNSPASFQFATRTILMQTIQQIPIGIYIQKMSNQNNDLLSVRVNEPLKLDNGRLHLRNISEMGQGIPIANLQWLPNDGQMTDIRIVMIPDFSSHNILQLGSDRYKYLYPISTPILVTIVNHDPSLPIILVAILFMTIGLTLFLSIIIRRNKDSKPISEETDEI